MEDTEKCFKQKLYGLKEDIRRYRLGIAKVKSRSQMIFFNGTLFFIAESNS